MLRIALLLTFVLGAMAPAIAADALAELRASFAVDGKPVPPEVFGDFGDAMMADNRPVVVSVDALAAIDSNRYADPVTTNGGWVTQKKTNGPSDSETMAYRYVGATANGLLVVIASWSGGGSGVFYWLHIVDAASTPAFDDDGSAYRRLTLTLLRTYALGDRWEGEARIAGNAIAIVTTASRAERPVGTVTLEARRP